MNEITFGVKIRQLREAKDISLRDLAKRIGVSAPFLSDVELGRRFLAADKLEALAKELETDLEELKKYDFRDEAENIKKIMFTNPAAGVLFRTVASQLKQGINPDEILKRLPVQRKK